MKGHGCQDVFTVVGLPGSEFDRQILGILERVIMERNRFYHAFTSAMERSRSRGDAGQVQDSVLQMVVLDDSGNRQYDRPDTDNVAVIIRSHHTAGEDIQAGRSITIHERAPDEGGLGLQRLPSIHQDYDPLVYVLFSPSGTGLGWHPSIPYAGSSAVARRHVTCLEYYRFRLFCRDNVAYYPVEGVEPVHEYSQHIHDILHLGGRLFQQWVVDQFCKLEDHRLTYVRLHQGDLRADLYAGLDEAIAADVDPAERGQRVVLPSSFLGGPRYMRQRYLDSMSIVRVEGMPSFFITMTANPTWPEITENLLPGQSAADRPDLVSRVFRMRYQSLIRDLTVEGVLGRSTGHAYAIEFQKRGLPHVHIVLWLQQHPRVDQYDRYVCAEIPDADNQPAAT